MCGIKRCQIYSYMLKKTCLGCFGNEEIRRKDKETNLKEEGVIIREIHDKDNEIGLKGREGGIDRSTTVLSIYAMHRSPSL